MHLCQKSKTFCGNFISFCEIALTFEQFDKKEHLSLGISEIIDSEKHGYLNS